MFMKDSHQFVVFIEWIRTELFSVEIRMMDIMFGYGKIFMQANKFKDFWKAVPPKACVIRSGWSRHVNFFIHVGIV